MRTISSQARIAAGLCFMACCVAVLVVACVPVLPWRHLRLKAANVFGLVAGRGCLWLAGVEVPAGLRERARAHHPAIYVGNHTSLLDMFIAIWLAPMGTCGVAKKEVVFYPFLGPAWLVSGHLLLDRNNSGNAVDAMVKATRMVRQRRFGVWMWPEGTRSRDGRLQPFKKGFAHIALATRLPIVPIAFTGVESAWERGTMRLRPCKLTATVLEPIPTDGWTLDNLDAHVREVHDALAAALPPHMQPAAAPVRRAA